MRLGSTRAGWLAIIAVLAVLAVLLAASEAFARSSLGIGSAEVTMQPGDGPFAGLFREIALYQREFFASLRQALIALKTDGGLPTALIGISLAYGVFHAAGPGHGKAVISAYLLASGTALKRGILLSFLSALLQAATAILVVGAGWYLLRGTAVSMTQATDLLEIASYGLIAGFGALLLGKAVLRRWKRRGAPALAFAAPGSHGGLAFSAAGTISSARAPTLMRPASGGFSADTCEKPEDDCGCGRSHIPDPKKLSGERFGLGSALSAVLAVGLRPCSGAIVVLSFALMNGLVPAGILSVLAMALGTAATVSLIAAGTVFARGMTLKAGRAGGAARIVVGVLEIGGALALLLLGLALLGGALQPV